MDPYYLIFLTEPQWAQCSVGSETCPAQGEGFGPPGWSTNFSMLIFLPAGSEVLPIWKFLDKRPFNPQLPFSKIHSPMKREMKSGMPRNNKIVGKAHAIPLCLHSATHISFNWSLFLTYIQYINKHRLLRTVQSHIQNSLCSTFGVCWRSFQSDNEPWKMQTGSNR